MHRIDILRGDMRLDDQPVVGGDKREQRFRWLHHPTDRVHRERSDGTINRRGDFHPAGFVGVAAFAGGLRLLQLDPVFGGTGIVISEVATKGKPDVSNAILIQSDERVPTTRVLAAGFASTSNSEFAIARYWR